MADTPRLPKDPGREVFYAPKSPDDDDDDAELELEARDPEILAAEERRAREMAEAAEASVDVDEIYREADRTSDYDFEIGEFRPQFQIKHLLMATAALAVVMAIGNLMGPITAVLFAILALVGGTLVYLNRKERAEQERREKDRQRRYKRQRELRAAQMGAGAVEEESPDEIRELIETGPAKEPFRFQFNKQEATIALVCGAIVLCLVFVLGPGPAALVLGIVALVGLAFEAGGFDAPRPVVLAWWFLLVIYIFVSIVAAIWERLG